MMFPTFMLISIPEDYIQALKDMGEYDSFCTFCHTEWMRLNRDSSNIGTTYELLEHFFCTINK